MINYVTHSLVKAAWIVALILLTLANTMFAQKNSKQEESTIHIKILKDVNGKQIEIDTTFTTEAEAEIFMRKIDADEKNEDSEITIKSGDFKNQSFSFYLNEDSTGQNKNRFNLGFAAPNWTPEEREKFNSEIKKLHDELKDEMGDFSFKMDTASALNNFNYNFNFKIPDERELKEIEQNLKHLDFWMDPMPASPIVPVPDFDLKTEGLSKEDQKKFEEAMQNAASEYKKAMELLKENNGKIIMPPAPPGCSGFKFNFEEQSNDESSNNNPKRVVIIQKSANKKEKQNSKSNATMKDGKSKDFEIIDFNYYPNPNNGKFDVSFSLPHKGDMQITITDSKGRTFYNETLLDFSGQYEQSFDLREEGAGLYLLKITQGKGWLTKKVVVK